ncbi:MAG: bifunctional riboflavin kinase/FAD synthetase [Propionibacteriaceae bacterium]|jgi:riboflavin kinase/FMN adenylyltransferase|nr:bifunctional riboflavin kinase/FAD synthetase [Propionibacteriaceae bacterium]
MTESAIAIGNFDGVHRGHQAIIQAAAEAAAGRPVVAITFWPHPIAVLSPDKAPALLTELPDRIELLKKAGADQVRVVEFTRQIAVWPPQRFVESVLLPLRPSVVVVGENFRFGHKAAGDGRTLAELSLGAFEVKVLPMLSDVAPLSSSRIRLALYDGDPARAAWMLGRWFRYSGIVVQGDQRGRLLGFPTANLTVPPAYACPQDGVYAGYLTVPGPGAARRWPAAVSVGSNPTFDGRQRRVEAHAIGQKDLDLYGVRVGVEFVERIRAVRRFADRSALTRQLGEDIDTAKRLLAKAGDVWVPGRPAPASAFVERR